MLIQTREQLEALDRDTLLTSLHNDEGNMCRTAGYLLAAYDDLETWPLPAAVVLGGEEYRALREDAVEEQ